MQESNALTQKVEQAREVTEKITGYLAQHPYAALVVLGVVLAIVALVKLARHQDPFGPLVRKRRVGASRMAWWLRAASRKRGGEGKFARHEWPALCKRYAGEFAAIIGGPGIGKTKRVLIPLLAWIILRRVRSAVVLDPKGEVFGETHKLCGRVGARPLVYLYSTLRDHPDRSVAALDPFADPTSRANFIEALLPDPPGEDPTWVRRGRRTLRELSDGLRRTGRPSGLLATYDVLKDPQKMDTLAREDGGVAGVWAGQGNRTHESARTEALSPLEGLEDPRIRRVFDVSRMDPRRAGGPSFEQRSFVYLCVGPDDAGRAGPLYAGLVDYLQRRAAYRKDGPKVDFLIEEAGSYFTLEKLDEYINLGRGYGVNLLLVLQNYDQLKKRLGDHAAASIVGAMDVLMFGRTRNAATGHLLEELSGTVRVERDAPRAMPSFFDYLFGTPRIQERRRIEEERPRIRAQDLYGLGDGNLFVLGMSKIVEWVVAERALWPRYARRVIPKDFDPSELRLVRPRRPRRGPDELKGSHDDPPSPSTCPACSGPVAAGVARCDGCGWPL